MILDFIIGVMLMGSLFHLSFAIWNTKVLSPFGKGIKSNIVYGVFVFLISVGLYIYKYGIDEMIQDKMYLGGMFALIYTVVFGLWINRKRREQYKRTEIDVDGRVGKGELHP